MFDTLSGKLGAVFDKLRGKGALTEEDVNAALREVRVALLEADVALPVAKDFIARVRERAVGAEVLRSVTPGQQVVKIVHDALVEMLGGGEEGESALRFSAPPSVMLMVGLQGSGKTTTTAKIALRLQKKEKKKVLMASLDTRRPAAMEQLKILGEQAGVDTLPIIAGQSPVDIAGRALKAAEFGGYDVVILDTAGRLSIDEALMAEVAQIHALARPAETLLVVDSLTGQDAVQTAEKFKERVAVTGVVLTRVDGDGRGGAALSMRAVTGAPIKLLGVGEKLDGLDAFDAKRLAGRILGMGDVVALVEKAAEEIDQEKAEKLAKKMAKGKFDLDDLSEQFRQMRKMGGVQGIMGLLPGMGKFKGLAESMGFDDRALIRQEAIISSMTLKERANPKLLNASRKKRIAAGSGAQVSDVNRLLKMHRQMADVMKKMGKGGMKGLAGAMMGGGLGGGAMKGITPPAGMTGGVPGGLPGLGGPGAPGGGLPGLGGPGMPDLGGGKKK
ncbi:MAG: signal recognition particle protein [Parvularculaceae bacterium]